MQKTLKKTVDFKGIGIHSGCISSVTLRSSEQNSGIVFINAKNPTKKFKVGEVVPEVAMHATVIKADDWALSTIEHLMASVVVLGINNVEIVVSGDEIPILDGSALVFVQGILDAGIQEQDLPEQYVTPRKEIVFSDSAGRYIQILPMIKSRAGCDSGRSVFISYDAGFKHLLMGNGVLDAEITREFFTDQLAPARTFGFLEQLSFLRQNRLAWGSSLGNTVVVGQELLNDLRFPDECVRHKVLDLLGDISLLGRRLVGRVKAVKTGHNFNRLVVESFVRSPDLWMIV